MRPIAYTLYSSPGYLFEGRAEPQRFISFLWQNMHPNYRVPVYDLTGRELQEWINVWISLNKPWNAVAQNSVLGLRGTNINAITTVNDLQQAMLVSPSINRYSRPAGHPLSAVQWNNARQGVGAQAPPANAEAAGLQPVVLFPLP